jgi:ADP-ribose pyrophosphatase YjhB (NUDIX family)
MAEQLGTVRDAETTNGADRRVCLVFQADGGSVLLGRSADEEWSLPWTQVGGEFNATENELEAAGRWLARELGLPSSAKELEYTGMCRFPELVRFSL